MGKDSHTPRTTKTRLPLPLNGTIYVTTREVATEKPLPVVGDTMAAELGPAWADSRIIAVQDNPANAIGMLVITHARIPSETEQLASNWEHSTCDIGGTKFASIQRSVIMLASAYQEDVPTLGTALDANPIGATNFGSGYILADRQGVKSGLELEPVFRLERRNYVKRVTLGEVVYDEETGRGRRDANILYYHGESVGGTTIQALAAAPENAYWGLQADGTYRTCQQLTEKWFSVTETSVLPASPINSGTNHAKARKIDRVTPPGTDLVFYETGAMPATIPEIGSAHYNSTDFASYKLTYIEPADASGKLYRFYYAKARSGEDAYNWEFTKADIGGQKFDAVARSYVTLRSAFNPATPTPGTAMPNTPTDLFAGTYILADRRQTRANEPRIDGLFVIDQHVYVKRVTITDIAVDSTLGVGVSKEEKLYYRGEAVSDAGGSPLPLVEALFNNPAHAFWGILSDGKIREGKQLTDSWFSVITTSSRDDALADYVLSLPTKTDLNLPDVLNSISVVWNNATSTGSFDSDWSGYAAGPSPSLSGSESASADASASVQPSLAIDITQPTGRDIPSTAYFFYLKLTSANSVSSSDFLTKVTALVGSSVVVWPTFKPKAHTITLKGQKVAVSARASGAAARSISPDSESWDKNEGKGKSFDVSTMMDMVRIPPCIHGAITISGATNTATASATCDVGWTGGTGGFPAVSASETASKDATGAVSPTTLSATTPAAIPSSGYYLVASKIQPYDDGWVQCYAEVINAADL